MSSSTIYVDKDVALDVAAKYNDEAEEFKNQESRVSNMESDLSEFQGDAATAAKDTLTRMQMCMDELASCILVHAGMVQAGTETFGYADTSAAAMYSGH